MGFQRICDGSLKPIKNPDEVETIGPLGREYGPEAAAICREYMAARDDLHSRLMIEWNEGLARLRARYRLPGKLPDE